MSATAITERLAELQSWRHGLSEQIERVHDFLRTNEFLAADTEAKLHQALAKVNQHRMTVAFVAEVSRGKSELINALFFTNLGRRLLPSGPGKGTRCVTELRFDRDVKTSVKLLPIETRESPKRFDELQRDEALWRSILFDADNAESTARALAALSETKRISLTDAVAWGLHREGVAVPTGESDATLVDVPRWRHAIINFPHPLLDAGLVIIDTPGLAAFTAEPELARIRVPNADALLLVLDINGGVTKSDLAVWKDHLGASQSFRDRETLTKAPESEASQSRFVVLNKIDSLTPEKAADPAEAARELMRDIDRRMRETADLLRIDPIRVIPVSAKLGLQGKLENDTDKLLKSRLYQLERGLVANLPRHRYEALGLEILAVLSDTLAAAQEQLDQERFETLEGLQQLGGLREKNEKLSASVVAQSTAKFDRVDAAMRELKSVRHVHSRLGEELAATVDVDDAKQDMAHTRQAIVSGKTQGGVHEVVRQYFSVTREKLDAAESKIQEIRDLFANIGERMRRDFGLEIHDVHPFATQRFLTELQKVQAKADTEFTKTSNLLVRRGTALAEQFDELISGRVLHIFEIASRETVTWMRGLYASVEKPLEALRQQTLQRSGQVEKMKAAELDLTERIAELQARLDVIKRKHAALANTRVELDRFAGKERATSAA